MLPQMTVKTLIINTRATGRPDCSALPGGDGTKPEMQRLYPFPQIIDLNGFCCPISDLERGVPADG